MRAIIPAAGLGSRLLPYTADRPKCMVEVDGVPILRRTVERLRAAGVDEVVVVGGYRAERIDAPGVTLVLNHDYRSNNVLASFFTARAFLEGEVVFAYSDVVYTGPTLDRFLGAARAARADFAVAVDPDWEGAYRGRSLHPVSEAELVAVRGGEVVEAGKHVGPARAWGEWCGLAYFAPAGSRRAVDTFSELEGAYRRTGVNPFPHAPRFEAAYMTDFFNELARRGASIRACPVSGGWVEVDTPEDLERVRRLLAGGAGHGRTDPCEVRGATTAGRTAGGSGPSSGACSTT